MRYQAGSPKKHFKSPKIKFGFGGWGDKASLMQLEEDSVTYGRFLYTATIWEFWLALLTFPGDWGLHALWRWHVIPSALETPWMIQNIKKDSLSLSIDLGSPSLGITSLRWTFPMSKACSDLLGKVSFHPVKILIPTKRCVGPYS